MNTTAIKWPSLLVTAKCALFAAFSITFSSISSGIAMISARMFAFELVNGLRLAGLHFAFKITQQKEVRRGQIWKSGWPVNVTSF